jgi:ABC-type dipeptide/oligopeptide/nickel transport system permease subunit
MSDHEHSHAASDEYSARQHETEEAVHSEEALEGRPFEVRSATKGLFGELLSDATGVVAMVFLILLGLMAIFAPWVAPYGVIEGSPSTASIPPVWSDGGGWSHVLGTDPQGYDVLSRLIYGTRTTLLVGVAVVLVAGVFGVVLGLLAGYRGGRTDRYIMRWVDIQVAFPGLLLALIMIAILGGAVSTVIFVLSFNGWMVYARMTRGVVLSVKERPFVEAAEVIGAKPNRVIFRHILPNLVSSISTLAVLEFARILLAEATLSFLGLGIRFPDVSLGLVANSGRDYLFSAPRYIIIPGVVLSLIVLAVNFVASWLRVVLDPQEREKRHAARVSKSWKKKGAMSP